MGCLGVVVGTVWLHAIRQFLGTPVLFRRNYHDSNAYAAGTFTGRPDYPAGGIVEEQGFHHGKGAERMGLAYWIPFFIVVLGNIGYHEVAKATPVSAPPFLALSVTYLSVSSCVLLFTW